jgi:hypothetical protein
MSATAFTQFESAARTRRPLLTTSIMLILFSLTFGQRIGFTFGQSQMPLCLPCGVIALGLLLFDRDTRIVQNRLILYILAMAVAIFSTFNKISFSLASLVYLISLYAIFVVWVPVPLDRYVGYLRIFQNLMLVFAAIGLWQLFNELRGGPVTSLFSSFPQQYLMSGYNTRPVLEYGSDFHKSTGDFFLEPSYLSQFCGIALILEYLYFRREWRSRWWRYLLYAGAIYSSFAGTGMVFLIVFAVSEAIRTQRFYLIILLAVAGGLLLGLDVLPHTEGIVGRITEYQDESSSAYARFIAPWIVLGYLADDFGKFMLGVGPGNWESYADVAAQTTFPVITKLVTEYGFITAVLFLAFATYCFFDGSRSPQFSVALLILYLFLTAALLQPHIVLLIYVLVMMMPDPRRVAADSPPLQALLDVGGSRRRAIP